MFAFLVAAALARDTSDADFFKAAAYDASVAAGTSGFSSALTTAQFRCTGAVPGCDDEVERLQSLDAAARRPPVTVAEAEEEPVARVPSGPRVVLVDQPTGLDYVATSFRPPAPWSGFEVSFQTSRAAWVEAVCVMKEGLPLPLGGDNPVSFSHEAGQPVYGCPSIMTPRGGSIYVPPGSQIYLMRFDALRQVYVVEEIRATRSSMDYRGGSIQRKLVTDLLTIRVR